MMQDQSASPCAVLFKNADGVRKHMQILADCLKPKFETVLNTLEKELKGSGLITWRIQKVDILYL